MPIYGAERLHALDDEARIVLVEGEKPAEALLARGIPAVGTTCGAAATPDDEALRSLSRLAVTLWPDNDEAGAAHMGRIGAALEQLGARYLRTVRWAGAPDKGDAADFDGDIAGLVEMLNAAEPFQVNGHGSSSSSSSIGLEGDDEDLQPIRAADFVSQTEGEDEDAMLLENRVPVGGVTLLASPPKTGKSRFARQLCHARETGNPFCGLTVMPGPSLYLALEERPADVRKHLRELGAKGTLVWPRPFRLTPENLTWLRAWIARYSLTLIVIDTLNRAWTVDNSGDRVQVDRALSPLVDLAHHTGCAFLILHHTRKSPASDPGTDVAESNDIVALVDQVLYLRRPDPRRHPRRRVIQAPGIGRYPEQPDIIIEFDDTGLYVALGDGEQVQEAEDNAAILDALTEWRTNAALRELTGLSEATVRRRLDTLLRAGTIERRGEGTSKAPFRYKESSSSHINTMCDGDDEDHGEQMAWDIPATPESKVHP